MTVPRNKYAWLEALWLLDLSGERLRVLGAIQSAHRDGASLISTAEIVKRTGLSRSAASRNLKAAERQKLVAVEWSRGGSRPHRITLLDPAVAVLDCGSQGAAVGEDDDCGSKGAAVTAALSRARVSDTLTLKVGGPLEGAPLPALGASSNVMDMGSPISPPSAPDGVVGEIVDPSEVAFGANGRMPSSVGPDAPSEADWIDEDGSTYAEKLEELRELVADLVRDGIRMPVVLDDFLESDDDPDEDALDRLLDAANDCYEAENRRVDDEEDIDPVHAARVNLLATWRDADDAGRENLLVALRTGRETFGIDDVCAVYDIDLPVFRARYIGIHAGLAANLTPRSRSAPAGRMRVFLQAELTERHGDRAAEIAEKLVVEILEEAARRDRPIVDQPSAQETSAAATSAIFRIAQQKDRKNG